MPTHKEDKNGMCHSRSVFFSSNNNFISLCIKYCILPAIQAKLLIQNKTTKQLLLANQFIQLFFLIDNFGYIIEEPNLFSEPAEGISVSHRNGRYKGEHFFHIYSG